MKVGIAMVPNTETIASLVELQKEIIPVYSLRPTLGTKFNLPHITLLQGRFRMPINWVRLISALRDYCREQKYPLEFKGAGLKYKPPGWYFLTLRPNILFADAHRFVFERLKNSMFLTKEDWQKDTSGYIPLEKYNYFRYGSRYIGDAFHPHITLGRSFDKSRFCDEVNLIQRVELFTSNRVGMIEKITIYEIGENGSHAATLYDLEI